MKIYSFKLKSLIFYSLFVFCAVCLIKLGSFSITEVYNEGESERRLPIYCVDRGDEKICALSFDAAWDDKDTDVLIEILNEHNVKTTFFVVGNWAEKYAGSVKKFADDGHEIMNHSDTHPHINQLSDKKIEEEIINCDDKIEAITKVRPHLFRGPYGEYNNNVLNVAEKLGHKTVQWDVDSLDWKELSADEIFTRVMKRVKPGSIMLFHNGAKHTPEALKKIIPELIKEGYKIVPVSELIYNENYTIDHSGKQKKAQSVGEETTEERDECTESEES